MYLVLVFYCYLCSVILFLESPVSYSSLLSLLCILSKLGRPRAKKRGIVTMQASFLGRGPSACISQLRLIVEDLHSLSLALNLIALAPETSSRFALPPRLPPQASEPPRNPCLA